MKWEKFKKERISLNYTVMLLPHSEKKPIHFKTPVWTFGLFFLGLLVLTGTCLFLAGSRLQLEKVREEKAELELEWEKLALGKQQADAENEALKKEQKIQEQELKSLEKEARDAIKELEELVEREAQIREELGLKEIPESPEAEVQGISGLLAADEAGGMSELHAADEAGTAELFGAVQIASVDFAAVLSEDARSFGAIQSQLGYLQASLTEKNSRYDSYLDTIEAKKAAEAAEKERRARLRDTIVNHALSYIGNAYVYGGNDPNTGVDCSGFTRYILSHAAGVYLNRTAAAQSSQGRAVSVENARRGDLVFYSSGGSIDHVAIYIGNGQIVHASNERVGIIKSNMYYRTPTKIVNVLGD